MQKIESYADTDRENLTNSRHPLYRKLYAVKEIFRRVVEKTDKESNMKSYTAYYEGIEVRTAKWKVPAKTLEEAQILAELLHPESPSLLWEPVSFQWKLTEIKSEEEKEEQKRVQEN